MQRRIGALIILLVASTALGCAMCAAPYDYTGPVPADGFGFNDRAGSILAGTAPSDMVFDGEVSEEAIGNSVPDGMQGEVMEGAPVQGQPTPAPSRYVAPSTRRPDQQWLR